MERSNRPMKRPRPSVAQTGADLDDSQQEPALFYVNKNLITLVQDRQWDKAQERALSHQCEAEGPDTPSPLAIACRFGAPYECVKAILAACPSKIRHLLGSRGTPLHEAVVNDECGFDIINELLQADESIDDGNPRAALLQDVDGYTPLHLLIRRRFQSYMLLSDEGPSLLNLLERLVRSSARAVVVPDRGEYEEPPIVMALKANVYAPLLESEDVASARIERSIFDMVNCMLAYYPKAASCIFNGYRGMYTALHSAVFHGRCPDTLELLLKAERRSPSSQKACLLGNTQGELPLHFCAMRGEPPRSAALLAEAAPEAVAQRDATGLTPLHWLWIRFVSTLLAIDEDGRDTTVTVPQERLPLISDLSEYLAFASLEQGNFEADLQLIRRLDPSVDFLRMRHIPSEVIVNTEASIWAERTGEILCQFRKRYDETSANDSQDPFEVSRHEAVASFFWVKIVALLKASESTSNTTETFSLVGAAFKSHSCPPPVAQIVATLHPEELDQQDADGRYPLHLAAMRSWHAWDWPREDGTSEAASAQLLQLESMSLVRTALEHSPPHVAACKDRTGALLLHHVIPTIVRAFSSTSRPRTQSPVAEVLDLVQKIVKRYPEALQERDPDTRLFPFLQASAVAAECEFTSGSSRSFQDEVSLSLVYDLLRANPSLVNQS